MAYESERAPKDVQMTNPKECIVFVHGICHGAWCWEENFVPYFSERGCRCYPVDLRGHGRSKESLKGACLAGYVEDTEKMVDQCMKETGMRPFLVGHSMGGAVVQKYIGEHADKVKGAVLFAPATAPHMDRWKTVGSMLRHRDLFQAAMVSWGIKSPKIVHGAAFFTSVGDNGERIQRIENTDPYVNLLQREPLKITMSELYQDYTSNRNVDLPILVIGSSADAYFPEESLKETAGEYAKNGKTALVVLEHLHLCHDMMLDPDWEKSAGPVWEFIEATDEFVEKHRWVEK